MQSGLSKNDVQKKPRGGSVSELSEIGDLQEYQAALAALQDFPWTVATGDDEKHLQALGKLPPKKKTLGETFINWWVSFRMESHLAPFNCIMLRPGVPCR